MYLCVWVFYQAGIRTTHMPDDYRKQKIVSDPPELKLRIAMNHHVNAETQTWVLCRATNALNQISSPLDSKI